MTTKNNRVSKEACKASLAKTPKILLVEDAPLVKEVHLMMLQSMDCETTLAENGRKALEYADKYKYDIIFMDIGLPDINGIDVTRKIRSNTSYKSNKSYIVALTAFTEDSLKQDCKDAGMDLVEKKPISTSRLQQICFHA